MRLSFIGLAALLAGCASTNSQLPSNVSNSEVAPASAAHNSWSKKKSMPHAVTGAGAVSIGTKIYVFGGLDSTLAPYGGTQIYNTSSNKWSAVAAMPTPRWDLDAVAVNGIIYTVGGNSTEGGGSNAVEAYDPKSNSWS